MWWGVLVLVLQFGSALAALPVDADAPIAILAQTELSRVMASVEKGLDSGMDQSQIVIALEARSNMRDEKPDRDIWSFGDGRPAQLGHGNKEIATRARMNKYLDYTVVMRSMFSFNLFFLAGEGYCLC